MERKDGRKNDQLRPVRISRGVMKHAEGSALIEMGDTRVICAATIEEGVPPHLEDTGTGWITAEYSMLPRATEKRSRRIQNQGRIGGRSQEIQRIIGRVLRACIDLGALGERTIIVDCDVLQADGGTRTASITGGFVALYDAVTFLLESGIILDNPVRSFVAAVSVGIVDGELLLDLDYSEDSRAEVDMNVAVNAEGAIVEIQGTAEKKPFSVDELNLLVGLARSGIMELIRLEKEILGE